MHPRYSGYIMVSVLIVNIFGMLAATFVNFISLEPALWAGATYGLACAAVCPLYVRHQRRNLHLYSEDMRNKVVWSLGAKPWQRILVVSFVMAVFGHLGLSTTGAAIFTRIAGSDEDRTFTVAKSDWLAAGRRRCYQVTLVEFPSLGQIHAPCYQQRVPEGTRLRFIGFHSSLGTWYSATRSDP